MSEEPVEHRITVDEHQDHDGYPMWKAFCTDECGWSGHWWHAIDYQDVDTDPSDAANNEAIAEGGAHVQDKTGDPA